MAIDEKMIGRFNFRQIIRWIIVAAIFGFLGKMVWNNWNQVKNAPLAFEILPLLLSTFIFVLSYFVQIWAWYLITLKLRIAISFRETLESLVLFAIG